MSIIEDWQRFIDTGAPEARRAVIEHYWPMVRKIARGAHGRLPQWVDYSDVVSWGTAGLISAVDGYDRTKVVEKGTSRGMFEAYALTRIRGSIIDELRSMDWAPRSLRRDQKTVEAARQRFEAKEGIEASHEDIAKEAGIQPSEVADTLNRVDASHLRYLDEERDEAKSRRDTLPDQTFPDPEATATFGQLYETAISEVFEHFTLTEKVILALHYYEKQTLSHVASVLELSESKVSALHATAISRLRGVMQAEFTPQS